MPVLARAQRWQAPPAAHPIDLAGRVSMQTVAVPVTAVSSQSAAQSPAGSVVPLGTCLRMQAENRVACLAALGQSLMLELQRYRGLSAHALEQVAVLAAQVVLQLHVVVPAGQHVRSGGCIVNPRARFGVSPNRARGRRCRVGGFHPATWGATPLDCTRQWTSECDVHAWL